MTSAPDSAECPYVGLQPFRESDYPYFFGRERDIRVIAANLREQPLTIVYGASGVGKSSVLRAGVLPNLRHDPAAVTVYFNTWQSDSFLENLTTACRKALNLEDAPIDKLVASGKRRLFLLLDQFEELLLYHQTGAIAEQFDSMLARLVNREDLAANVLIGIREDALSRFDQRFSIRIADALANTLPLGHLNNDAARRAMIQPLRVFNELHPGGPPYSMEPELAEDILRQVQPRRYAEAVGGEVQDESRVETPFLQLVLRRLWDEEAKNRSRTLRLLTLRQIGGAGQIVEKHVNDVLANLARHQDRDIAAGMFQYLVTPSRSKIAQDTESLIGFANAPETEVRIVLSLLSDRPESRILRRLDTPERYEIFHDVLAQPILDWRKRHFAQKEKVAEVRKRRRLQLIAAGMFLMAVLAIAAAWFAFEQRRIARESADLAELRTQEAIAAQKDAQAARAEAQKSAAELSARQAELQGRTAEAARLKQDADEYAQEAVTLRTAAQEAREYASGALDGKDKNYRDALQQAETMRRERDQLQARVTALSGDVALLKRGSTSTGPVVASPVKPASSLKLFLTNEAHSGAVQGIAVTADGRQIISASADFTLNIMDLSANRSTWQVLKGHSGSVQAVAVIPYSRQAISASSDKTLRIWNLDNARSIRELKGHTDAVYGVAVTPDGRRAVSASRDRSLKVWDLATGRLQHTYTGHADAVFSVAMNPDGRSVVSASGDKTLAIWDLVTGTHRALQGHTAAVYGVAVSPNARWAASASADRTVRLWDLGAPSFKMEGHTDSVHSTAFSPDSRWIVSASADKTVKVWATGGGALIASLTLDARAVSCTFVREGVIAVGDQAGHIHVLSLDPPAMAR